jgi:hypothetical protein
MKIAVAVGVLVLQQAIRRHQSQSLEQVRGLTSVRLEDSPTPKIKNKELPDVSVSSLGHDFQHFFIYGL